MSDAPKHMRRNSSIHTPRDRASSVPGPLCLWRYLFAWCIVAVIWIGVVYVKAVVWKQRAMYGSSLLYLAMGFACFAYLAEETYVWWKEQRGTAGQGDYPDPGTKRWILGAVVVSGGCLTFGITLGLLRLSGVWTPERGMGPPADPPPADVGPGPGVVPPGPSFAPTTPRPLATTPPRRRESPTCWHTGRSTNATQRERPTRGPVECTPWSLAVGACREFAV